MQSLFGNKVPIEGVPDSLRDDNQNIKISKYRTERKCEKCTFVRIARIISSFRCGGYDYHICKINLEGK